MHISTKLIAAAVIALSSSAYATAANIGYCVDNVKRDGIFRLGATEKQGMAMRLSAEKVSALKGRTIKGVRLAVGSSRMTDGINLFIASDLAGTPLVSQKASVTGAVKWLSYTLDTPYTVKGDEGDLYIGYTTEMSNTSSQVMMADGASAIAGATYAWFDGRWVDLADYNHGQALLGIDIDGEAFGDLILKPVHISGFLKAHNQYALTAEVFNFGSAPVSAFDATVKVGSGAPVTLNFAEAVAPGASFQFTLPAFEASAEGNMPLDIELSGIVGELDSSDNAYTDGVYFYPEHMERAILLEGFTGSACSNCPAGHATINEFIEETDVPIVEVMHHAGYQPDAFTMDVDVDYVYFYGAGSTYAPAVMLNRQIFPEVGNVPVMNTSLANLRKGYETIVNTQPYVSLGIESTFNPETREVKVDATVYTHVDLPGDINTINVLLTQHGIQGLQVPYGPAYIHNAVCRGALTGNAWGIQLPASACQAGGSYTYSTTFTLPEVIVSDYTGSMQMTPLDQRTIPTDPERMTLVAYVAPFAQNDIAGHAVYNTVECVLGDKYLQGGLASAPTISADAVKSVKIHLDGRRVVVDGEYQSLQVYSIDGSRVNADGDLTPGLYIARVMANGKPAVAKLLVK